MSGSHKRVLKRRGQAAYLRRQRLEERQTADSLQLWSDSDRTALQAAYRELKGNRRGSKATRTETSSADSPRPSAASLTRA